MTYFKYDFLNWQPDIEDFKNPGLRTADNVYHDVEGYKQYKASTTGSFATNAALATCPSVVIKSVGTNNQRVACYLHNATAAGAGFTIDMSIGLLNAAYGAVNNYTTVTSNTILNAATLNRVVAFGVCELADKIFFVARAEMQTNTALTGSTNLSVLNLTGYAAI